MENVKSDEIAAMRKQMVKEYENFLDCIETIDTLKMIDIGIKSMMVGALSDVKDGHTRQVILNFRFFGQKEPEESIESKSE